MRSNFHAGRYHAALLLLCVLVLPWAAMAQGTGKPGIKILVAPSVGGDPNRMETIKGEVTGGASDEYRVALFSQADGRWWPQPFLTNQQTRLDDEGKFTTQIHLGTRYAALLVSGNFPPQPAELFDLPNVGGDILAMDFADPGETRTGADEPLSRPASATLLEEQAPPPSPPVSIERILTERLGLPSPSVVLAEVLSLVSQLLSVLLSWLLWALLIFAALVCVLTFLMLLTAIPAVVVGRIEEFVQAVAASLGAVVNASNALVGGVEKTITDWMSEEKRAKPSWMLIGLICLVIAPLATLANYQLLYFSMESLIPPSSDALWLVAGTLTALHAVAGLLLHTSQRFGTRMLIYGLLIVSLSCEGWFSFQRTMELENAVNPPTAQTLSGAEPDAGTDVDVNPALLSKQPPTAESTPAEPVPSEQDKKAPPPWWSWSAIAMALITLVCGVGEAVGWFAAFHLAGKPLCWAFFAPVYLPAKLLSWALSGANDGRLVNWVQVELRSILESPSKHPTWSRDRKIDRATRRGEAIRTALEQAEKNAAAQHQFQLAQQDRKLESIRIHYDRIIRRMLHRYDLKERKSAHRHLATLNQAWRAHVTELQKIILPNMREQFASIYEQAVAAIVEEVRKLAREKVALTGEQIAEIVALIVAEELRKYTEVFSAMNGHYPRNDAWKASYSHANAGANSRSNRKEQQ